MSLKRLLACLLLTSTAATAEDGLRSLDPELDPIVVNPRPDPFDDSMQRLRQSMENPDCRGCPPELQAYRKSVYEQLGAIVGFFTGVGRNPPQLSPQQRVEYRIRNEWRRAELGPEMDP